MSFIGLVIYIQNKVNFLLVTQTCLSPSMLVTNAFDTQMDILFVPILDMTLLETSA
jgi:hypothetical protein